MKFLFYPAPAHGHVNPLLPLLRELVSRGEEVVVHLPREYEAAVRDTGASLRPLDDCLDTPASVPGGGGGPMLARMLPAMMEMLIHSVRAAPALVEQARAERADCVVYDPMALWGRAIAAKLDVPKAIFHTTLAVSHSPTVRAELKKTTKIRPPPSTLLAMLKVMWISEVFHWRHGMPRADLRAAFRAVEDLNIIPVPRTYQPDAGNFDERFLFVGPSVQPRNDRGDFPLEQLDGKPVLLVSLGTTPMNQRPDFYKACFQAFRDTRWRVVMARGKGTNVAELGPVPSNFLVRERVPQLDVLERARVFITHGGMNSTFEGLWHGVPLAVFPQFGDQPFNAARVTGLGLGATLSASEALDPKALRETVERLDTDPGYRARVAAFQKELRGAGGHLRAADALQRYAAARAGKGRKAA